MKTLLTRLTLLSTTAVIAVIAVYLIQIAIVLIRANRNLTGVARELEATRDNTAPLSGDLETINGAAVTLRDRLAAVDGHLSGISRLVRG